MVLARVIVDRDQVSLTAEGVTSLVELLQSKIDNVVILSGSSPSRVYCTVFVGSLLGVHPVMISSSIYSVIIHSYKLY